MHQNDDKSSNLQKKLGGAVLPPTTLLAPPIDTARKISQPR